MNTKSKIDSLATACADRLESKLNDLLTTVLASEQFRRVADPAARPKFVATAIKYILLEVFSYGPHVTEATFTSIGRLPKSRPDLMKPMIMHDLEEVDHGALLLPIAGWALYQLTGNSLVLAAATERHGAAQVLKGLGGFSLEMDGKPLPPFFDSYYSCHMELIGFDSRRPSPKYAAVVEETKQHIMTMLNTSGNGSS